MSLEKDFLILDAIDRYRPRNQRELANTCGLSLGKTNSVLRKVVNQGLVRTLTSEGDVKKNRKRYFLTSKGREAKAALSSSFIKVRMKEFEDFRNRLLENLLTLQEEGVGNLLVLGSHSVGSLLGHIARRENLAIRVIGTVCTTDHFGCFDANAYDRILLAEDPGSFSKLLNAGLIPQDKVTYLR